MATRYTLTVINNPSRIGSFAVFQQPPPRVGSVLPLAWFAMPTAPHTQVSFEWTLDDNPLPSDSGVSDARTCPSRSTGRRDATDAARSSA